MNLPTLPISGKIILVVDDNVEMREVIVRALEIEGYTVVQAANGQVAMEILQRISPELILSDINMPEMDGLEFYRALRNNPNWVAIPFIFLTANTSHAEIQTARELGVEDYLIKPIAHDELVKIVNARLLRSAELQIAYINQAYLETVKVLANTIETRDPYTHGHVERVATYARWLANALSWPAENMRMLEFGSRLHDIGKIIVPDHILKKPGQLTPEEWSLMKQHTEAGAKILRGISHLQIITPYVLHHHERWDGSGYPHGLKGREIPLEGRLLAIADVYDALTSARPYHPARSHRDVIRYLQIRSGTHFDPDLSAIFIQVLEKKAKSRWNGDEK
jgi:putative two-component system response regulator